MKRLLFVVVVVAIAQVVRAQDAREKSAPPAAPADERVVTGSAEFGYRWVGHVNGDINTYQSIVTLDSGPRLFGADLTIRDPSRKVFDRAEVRASSWGGDPYNTVQADVRQPRFYRLQFDYRKIAYFNALPSFANPSIQQGSGVDERSFDTFRRTTDVRLTLFPAARISPYAAYTRNSGGGTAVTALFGGSHNFPVAARLSDHTDTYRAGAQLEFNQFHVTVEQGASSFRNSQTVLNTGTNRGDVAPNIQPYLANLLQTYDVQGRSVFTRLLATANPAPWASVLGQVLYSRPDTDVRFSESQDTFVSLNASRIDSGQQQLVVSSARLPHATASVGVELRPGARVRILESWTTDRVHNDSTALQHEQFVLPVPVQGPSVGLSDRLVRNYSQQQVEVQVDLTPHVMIRGGHRYTWGHAEVWAAQPTPETADLRRHVALVGVALRFGRRFDGVVDVEVSPGQRTFFRTDLYDYQRTRARIRYKPAPSWLLAGDVSFLGDSNPTPSIDTEVTSHQGQVSATWNPGGNLAVTGEYSRFTLRSRFAFATPRTLEPALSIYRDDGHIANGIVSLILPVARSALAPRLSAGVSFFSSSGSRPTRFMQPLGRLSLTLRKGVELNSELRWYTLSQTRYPVEAFRAREFVTRIRVGL